MSWSFGSMGAGWFSSWVMDNRPVPQVSCIEYEESVTNMIIIQQFTFPQSYSVPRTIIFCLHVGCLHHLVVLDWSICIRIVEIRNGSPRCQSRAQWLIPTTARGSVIQGGPLGRWKATEMLQGVGYQGSLIRRCRRVTVEE